MLLLSVKKLLLIKTDVEKVCFACEVFSCPNSEESKRNAWVAAERMSLGSGGSVIDTKG